MGKFFYSSLWNLGHVLLFSLLNLGHVLLFSLVNRGHVLLFLFVPVLSDASSMSNKHNKVKQIKGLVKGRTE